jgi:hypothetical protein
MMRRGNDAVDHVGASIRLDQVGRGFDHRLEQAGLGPG